MTPKLAMYMQFLQEEGFRPKEEDGDAVFKFERGNYVIFSDEQDPQIFRMEALWLWSIDDEPERLRVFHAAAAVTGQYKAVKVFPMQENVCATIELLFAEPDQFKALFPRALGLLQAGVREFRERMQAGLPPSAPVAQA